MVATRSQFNEAGESRLRSLIRRFRQQFGPEAEANAFSLLFNGRRSSLGGCFRPPAHNYIMEQFLLKVLERNSDTLDLSLKGFMNEIKRQRLDASCGPVICPNENLPDMVLEQIEQAAQSFLSTHGRQRFRRAGSLPDTKITKHDIQ